MNAYPDTSLLCALYRPQTNSGRAAEYVSKMAEREGLRVPL